jgi:hypothetical protein
MLKKLFTIFLKGFSTRCEPEQLIEEDYSPIEDRSKIFPKTGN